MQKKSVFFLHVKIMYNLQKLISDRSHKPNCPNYLKNFAPLRKPIRGLHFILDQFAIQ